MSALPQQSHRLMAGSSVFFSLLSPSTLHSLLFLLSVYLPSSLLRHLRSSLIFYEICFVFFLTERKMRGSIPLPYLSVKYEATVGRQIA